MAETADPLRQTEARAFGRRRRRIGLASNVVELAALVAIVAATGSIGGPWALVLLVAGLFLLGLPFGLAGYRLSRAHGLSRQTPRGWLADRLKGAGIGLALGAVAAAGLLGIQRAAGDWWPLPAWVAIVAFSAVLAALWPVLLLPIFLRSEPMAAGDLADALWDTATRADVHVRDMRLLKMGEKTAAANAMVAGLGPTVRIYVSDTLAEVEDGEDADGALARTRVVLAHELGHHVHRDMWRLMTVSAASLAAGILGAWGAVAALAPHGPGHLSTLPAVVLGFTLASAAVSPFVAAYSRRRERAADAYAARLAGEGETFARAMERLVARNLSELEPPRLYHLLTSSHPTPAERIAVARAGRRVPAG
ncbi:MAG TPA: M48 family metalloprotease [Gaiellales bacterium]|nr:M48 family metalloprotease [Gaiellales bacterium]